MSAHATIKCPNCGAPISAPDGAESAVCEYCDCTVQLENASRIVHVKQHIVDEAALKNAIPERFGGVATLSGALDLPLFGQMCADGIFPDMPKGEFDLMFGAGNPVPPEADAFALLEKAAALPVAERPRLCSFCGTDDFLLDVNRRFDERATELGYDHLYREWEGDHEWRFWQVAIQRALQYLLGFDLETTPIW